ncbi:GNAT family N-acetyltransferase [Roseivirga sp.]|uniref:GNAT family N-acetyltransferase n=1 Tax=Roseivirga sp. TaxID=1964215 RepID=UPI003B52040A
MKTQEITFHQLSDIEPADMLALMNNAQVRQQMPLFNGDFTQDDYERFIAAKEELWQTHGYGPWAFKVNGVFAGWGGLQPENGDADLALVLLPRFWGVGRKLYRLIIEKAFKEMQLPSVTILFPPSRTRIQGILRLGFKEEDRIDINGYTFIKYRLMAGNA